MNVGDTMIWEGELQYLRSLRKNVVYEADQARFDPQTLEESAADATVLLHGGGNFGDVWGGFQQFREEVVGKFPHRRIVQLPQTVKFSDESGLVRANEIFGKHPNFILMVRDLGSLDTVRRHMPDVNVVYCPDMALGIENFRGRQRSRAKYRCLVIARTDHEKAADLSLVDAPSVDWGLTGPAYLQWKLARVPGAMVRRLRSRRIGRAVYPLLRMGYSSMRRLNLDSGVSMVSSADVIVTDRLHVHVLSGLLGREHIVLDNNYGKVKSIFDNYTHNFPTAHFAHDARAIKSILANIRLENDGDPNDR
ncbi:polysaccharide pyruvyl transferase family protein [Rhodococcoides fascians]|uniref:polysaccharide pyruvyl transferase family protein n=1 Tax=Rhodococcoides fascians TaxID=1828 RepID=UPI0009B901BB